MNCEIHPIPTDISYLNGEYKFGKQITLRYNPNYKKADSMELMAELWQNFTFGLGKMMLAEDSTIEENSFVIDTFNGKLQSVNGEDYALSVCESGAKIVSDTPEGTLRGYYTFLHLIKPRCLKVGEEAFAMECQQISDTPGIKFRCIHISVSCGNSIEFYRKYVRFAAFMKYTHVIFEFWASLRYSCCPELAWSGGFTKPQFKPIIEEAKKMGMEVIPMFNHLGHASGCGLLTGRHVVLDQDPTKALLFEPTGWSFCISNPDTLELLRSIREELIELCGEGEYFHIGMDEAHDFATCDLCSSKDKIKLLVDFVNNISEDLAKQGRKTMMWADMVLEKAKFPLPYVANSTEKLPLHKVLDTLSKDIIMVDWQYYLKKEYEGKIVETTKFLMEKGFKVILAPWDDFDNIKLLAKNAGDLNAYGFMETIWGKYDVTELSMFAAEAAWFGKRADEIDSFRHETRFYYVGEKQRKLLPTCGDMYASGMDNAKGR